MLCTRRTTSCSGSLRLRTAKATVKSCGELCRTLWANTKKSELLWCATARRQHQLSRCPYRIGPDTIIPSTAVRDLGIYFDSDLSMKSEDACPTVCHRLLCSPASATQHSTSCSVVCLSVAGCALVLSRLDYGNASRLACLTVSSPFSTRQFGRSIAGLRRSEHIQTLSPIFTVFEHPSASSHRLPSSSWHCTSVGLPVGSAAVRRRSADETPRSPALVDFQSS